MALYNLQVNHEHVQALMLGFGDTRR